MSALEPEPDGDADDAATPDASAGNRPPLKRRLALMILAAGAIGAIVSVLPHWPTERVVELRLEHPEDVTGVDVTWLDRKGSAEGAPVQGGSWRFAPGSARRILSATVRLPDGIYDVEITVLRTDRRDAIHRSLTLGEGDRITIPLE